MKCNCWIDVRKIPPPVNGEQIILYGPGNLWDGKHVVVVSNCLLNGATHWMPLPPPPGEDIVAMLAPMDATG